MFLGLLDSHGGGDEAIPDKENKEGILSFQCRGVFFHLCPLNCCCVVPIRWTATVNLCTQERRPMLWTSPGESFTVHPSHHSDLFKNMNK